VIMGAERTSDSGRLQCYARLVHENDHRDKSINMCVNNYARETNPIFPSAG
jgi:hypothetical protein